MVSQWLQEKYIALVSPQLGHFHRQSRTTYTFRCVFCGDSQKRQNKTRGYLFLYQRQYFYKCHNCNISMSLRGFLKRVNEELFREYQLDLLRQERPSAVPAPSAVVPSTTGETPMFGFGSTRTPTTLSLPTIASLPEDHLAVQYCRARQLPDAALSHLYFTDAWTTWLSELAWPYAMPEDHAPRLILPWFDRQGVLQGAQARRIDVTGKAGRYITLKSTDDTEKLYGLDRWDRHRVTYMVEGPLDSWFLPNALAAMSADLLCFHEKYFSSHAIVYIWDNEPRNLDVSRHLYTAITRGFRVVIWPPHIQEKDLNDMARAGHDILSLVTQHTYQGLRAQLEYLRWKKVNERSSITEK